jgi:hypothetical protein
MSKNMRRPAAAAAEHHTPAAPGEDERRCPECGVKLSSYNPGPNCWSHTMGWPWRGPSARPKL